MPKGTIRKLSERGYGFIKAETGGPDIFFHASALADGAVFDELEEGQKVEFDKGEGKPGAKNDKTARPKAENVKVI
jgi:CspA family cold shock protein